MLIPVRYGVIVCSVILLLGALFDSGCFTVAEEPSAARLRAPGPDFAVRCDTPGVLRCVNFDTDADFNFGAGGFNAAWGQNFGYMPPSGTTDYSRILRDMSVAASGVSSLRFTIPSRTGADSSGSWFTNITSDLSQLIGNGQTLYVGWRQRFDTNYVDHNFQGSAGKKLLILGAGDRAGAKECNPSLPTSTTCPTSCTDIELVPTVEDFSPSTRMGQVVRAYNSCTLFRGFEFFDSAIGQVNVQNANPGGCRHNGNPALKYLTPPCFRIYANEWMHFKIRITIGTFNTTSSTFQLWAGREGRPAIKIIDFSPATGHPWNAFRCRGTPAACNVTQPHEYGKIWLLPYATGKSPAEVHPTAYTWYDDLIISTQDFADP